jgi:hypothetical protein
MWRIFPKTSQISWIYTRKRIFSKISQLFCAINKICEKKLLYEEEVLSFLCTFTTDNLKSRLFLTHAYKKPKLGINRYVW